MAISKERKVEILSRLKSELKQVKTLVFANFHGLKVAETTALRRALGQSAVSYLVAKKTLIRRALDEMKVAGEMPALDGEVALAYSADQDELAPAREVYNFGKKLPASLKIIGGVFGGRYLGAAAMNELAVIPPRPALLQQVVGLLNSPLGRLARVVAAIADKKSA